MRRLNKGLRYVIVLCVCLFAFSSVAAFAGEVPTEIKVLFQLLEQKIERLERKMAILEQLVTKVFWRIAVKEVSFPSARVSSGVVLKMYLNGTSLGAEEWTLAQDVDGDGRPDLARRGLLRIEEFDFELGDELVVELWGKSGIVANWVVDDPSKLTTLCFNQNCVSFEVKELREWERD